ncbi:hypothetical protein, partial [Hyphomicrobium sp. 2TAF46]|uniref:hypothetical protein n=1 Tax=Hyphomicrobium sp. 2TAF46 TaxID=3233019 RepID=UPI003F8F62DB
VSRNFARIRTRIESVLSRSLGQPLPRRGSELGVRLSIREKKMGMYVLFGVKDSGISDVDDAAAMVARVIKAMPIGRIAEDIGAYCRFETGAEEEAQVVSGTYRDEDGDYRRFTLR